MWQNPKKSPDGSAKAYFGLFPLLNWADSLAK
jgi:hypothetical protein